MRLIHIKGIKSERSGVCICWHDELLTGIEHIKLSFEKSGKENGWTHVKPATYKVVGPDFDSIVTGKFSELVLKKWFHTTTVNVMLVPFLIFIKREVITYTISSRPINSLVSTMLDQTFTRLTDQDTLLLHSDQGWHYQMKHYRKALSEKGVTQSMYRKGNCSDNAVIENSLES